MPTKYKVWDFVTVRKDLSRGRRYKNYNSPEHDDIALEGMIRFAGKRLVIKEITWNQKYICWECPVYYWTDEMFEESTIREEDVYRDEEDETVISSSETVDLLSLYEGK